MKTAFKLPENFRELETRDEWMRSFLHESENTQTRVNVWGNSRNGYFTVGTVSKKKLPVYQKYVTKEGVEKILRDVAKKGVSLEH